MTKTGKKFKKAILSGEIDISVRSYKKALKGVQKLPLWWERAKEDPHDTFMDGVLQGYLAGLRAKKERA